MEIILKYFSDFSPRQLDQFKALDELYKDWNEKINVISRKDMDGLYEKHVLHSLSIAAVFEFRKNMELLDLGTGGGFPGIPLAIYFPDVKFHLVDSIGKKLKVVDAIIDALELKNTTTQHTRAEDLRDRKFDFVVSRAVAPLNDLWKWSKPLLKSKHDPQDEIVPKDANADHPASMHVSPGLICLKGGDLSAEIHEVRLKPRMFEITQLFQEPYFNGKYLLYLHR